MTVFLLRAINDPQKCRIYCLVHSEKLKYIVAEKTMELITMLSQGASGMIPTGQVRVIHNAVYCTDYRLVIVCSSEGEQKSLPVSRLQKYRRSLPNTDPENIKEYVQYHLKYQEKSADRTPFASFVDEQK